MNAQSPIVAAPVLSGDLSTRAMLANVSVSLWSARKLDRKVTAATNDAHNASADAGRYNKALIDPKALADLNGIASQIRVFHYAKTLPWLDDGARILPAALYADYTAGMRDLRLKLEAAVTAFVAAYPTHVDAARVRLNGMFVESDYPAASEIADKFGFQTRILPMPAASDFRVTLADDQAAAIRAEITESTHEAVNVAMRDAWSRVTDVVGRMVDRLNAYKPATTTTKAEGVFRDSLVENIRELVGILPSFNLTGDAFLTGIVARMESELCTVPADTLRNDEGARREAAAAAAAILADVSQYLA